jgi:hypothetical protein
MAAREGEGRTGREGIGHRQRTGANKEPGQECTVARVFFLRIAAPDPEGSVYNFFGSKFEAPLVEIDFDPDSTLLPLTI